MVTALLVLAGCAAGGGKSAQITTVPPPPTEIAPMTGVQHAAALNDPTFIEGVDFARSGKGTAAREAWERASLNGNPLADYELALNYLNDSAPDGGKSLSHAYAAALKGYAPAQSFIGNHYERVAKVPGNLDLAMRWYHFAAMQGEPIGSSRLAMALFEKETPQDFTEALTILNRCAQPAGDEAAYRPVDSKGGAPCQSALGLVYLQGMGGEPVDIDKAVLWFQRAADQHQQHAEEELAKLYEQGAGVPKDSGKAADWHRRAQEDSGRSLDSWTPL